MALAMFLKIDGVVGGTSNYDHNGWADILSWDWTLARTETGSKAAGSGNVNMNRINVKKAIGPESSAILALFAQQSPIKNVEISAVPVVGKRERADKYMSIVMEDALIMGVRTNAEGEDNFFRETLVLQFDKVKYETFHHGARNASGEAGSLENFEFAWDIKQNAIWPSA